MTAPTLGNVVALPEEYDLMSHVSGVYSDDGASTFIANMLSDDPKKIKRRIKRSHSTSNVPVDVQFKTSNEKPEEATEVWGWTALNDLSPIDVKPKRKNRKSSKSQKSKRKTKKAVSGTRNSVSKKSREEVSKVGENQAPATPQSRFTTVLAPKISPGHRVSMPELSHSAEHPHAPPHRFPSSPSASTKRRSTRRVPPSPSKVSNIRPRRPSRTGRRVSPSPSRSASPHNNEQRRTSTRRRLSRSRSPSNSRSTSPSGGSISGNSSYGSYGTHSSHQNSRRRKSRNSVQSRSISPSNSWDRGSATGESRTSSLGSTQSGSRRTRSRCSIPSQPVRDRTLSPGSLRRHKQSGRLSKYLNDKDDNSSLPFRRLSPRSAQSIRRKSGNNIDSMKDREVKAQPRRKSDPVLARTLRVRSKSPSSRWTANACKSPPSVSRRRHDTSKSPSTSRKRLSNAFTANRQLMLQIANDAWDGDDSFVWKQPSKAYIMDDESSWTRP